MPAVCCQNIRKDEMLVGVKFCGGCNPRYDRGAYFARVKAENPLCGFEIAEEEKQYDVLLVIGGCPSCCASCEQYHFERIVRVWEERSVWKWTET